jgi:hypothetical protein
MTAGRFTGGRPSRDGQSRIRRTIMAPIIGEQVGRTVAGIGRKTESPLEN